MDEGSLISTDVNSKLLHHQLKDSSPRDGAGVHPHASRNLVV